jgi:hypothetical protein
MVVVFILFPSLIAIVQVMLHQSCESTVYFFFNKNMRLIELQGIKIYTKSLGRASPSIFLTINVQYHLCMKFLRYGQLRVLYDY